MIKAMIVTMALVMSSIPSGEGIASMRSLQPKANEISIGRSCIEMPMGLMLLIRKNNNYCAMKFNRNWTAVDEKARKEYEPYVNRGIVDAESAREAYEKKYAAYTIYYQGDGGADFSKGNVIKSEHIASWLPLQGPFRPFIYQPGDAHIKCGPFKIGWEYKNAVCFIPSGKGLGDYGIELAPTPWTDIEEVNVFDPRVKWYRYDDKRKRVNIPIDQLWEK